MLKEMKRQCGLSLEHNPQVGFGWKQGGGFDDKLEHTIAYFAESYFASLGCSFSHLGMYV